MPRTDYEEGQGVVGPLRLMHHAGDDFERTTEYSDAASVLMYPRCPPRNLRREG